MNKIDDFKVGERVFINSYKVEAIIIEVNKVSEVVSVSDLTNGETIVIMNLIDIRR